MTFIIHPVILCGGAGTRLWPLSTPDLPKQFLALTSDKSMIEDTAQRLRVSHSALIEFQSLVVVGSKRHSALLETTLPEAQVILEPVGRNSAPAIAAACLTKSARDLVLILPADHDIRDIKAFHEAIQQAARAAVNGSIVTFGIEPTHPSTGYGYIQTSSGTHDGALPVTSFVEKPDLETAKSYLKSDSYYWNAGIFLFQAGVMLNALDEFEPSIRPAVEASISSANDKLVNLDADCFEKAPNISIDYAVMERSPNVRMVPANIGWSDVGGYRALHQLLTESDSLNYTCGPVFISDSNGLYVRSEGPTVSVSGISDLVVIATPNEVMIAPRDDDAVVKELGATVQSSRHTFGISEYTIKRTKSWLWDAFETWADLGWDLELGGFVEQLNRDGTPDLLATRRVRVQARQIYSFSKAIDLGWRSQNKARTLVEHGIEYMDARLRHQNGGFVHTVNPDGTVLDGRRDLYDHAFIILAGAAAFRATGLPLALDLANEAISYISNSLKDAVHGGWFESSEMETPRRANPHMHLLEALLEFYSVTGSKRAIEHAAEIVDLFETHFFDPSTNVMGEYFTFDWQVLDSQKPVMFEPGHHYEWASLLHQYERNTGHDTLSWRRRLIRKADQAGLNRKSGFAINALRSDGQIVDPNSRLWHQLEMVKSYLLHRDVASSSKIEAITDAILSSYSKPAPHGTWIDEVDSSGQPVSTQIPASMLYHLVTLFQIMK